MTPREQFLESLKQLELDQVNACKEAHEKFKDSFPPLVNDLIAFADRCVPNAPVEGSLRNVATALVSILQQLEINAGLLNPMAPPAPIPSDPAITVESVAGNGDIIP